MGQYLQQLWVFSPSPRAWPCRHPQGDATRQGGNSPRWCCWSGGEGNTLRALPLQAKPLHLAGFPNAPMTNSTFIKVHLGNTVTSRHIALPM